MSSHGIGESRALAGVLASTRAADVPADVLEHARRSVVDWFGSALGGSLEPPARMAQRVGARFGTSNEATVFSGGRASAAVAAFANGVATHILELDDIHKGSTVHAAAPVISAAAAVAEREHASGRDFLAAVALGYEAAFRIGEAVNPSHYYFFHPTGTVATFGAAAAAGALTRLDATRMLDALGSAGTQAAALWEFNADGAMSKHLHPGKAAMNGIMAADLAAAGFTGATRILEGERGFFRALTQQFDASRVTDALGTRWKIGENGYKLYSCCGHTHTAVDVALDLRAREGWSGTDVLEQVNTIDIETYGPGYEIVKEMTPRTPYQAKFSLAYCVAAALVEGRLGLPQFAADRFDASGVRHREIAELLPRVRVTVAPDLTAAYPAAWPTRVSLTTRTGCTAHGAASFPRGNAENPVSTADLERKCADLLEARCGVDVARRGMDALRRLESCSDLADLFRPFGDVATATPLSVTTP